MSDFRFESAFALQGIWLLPVFYFLTRFFTKKFEKKLSQSLSDKLKPFLTASLSVKRRLFKNRFELLVLALMILAYARPQSGEGRQQVKNEGIEILFLVDISNSMLAEDVRPSRLEVMKTELERFIEMSSGDRMGLVAFAGSAVLLSPMTIDQDAIKMYVESLSPNAVSTQGTDFAKALQEARDAFQRGGLGQEEGLQVTRAIVILSDGEDQEPGALKLAEELQRDGIHIFSLAFGTEQGGAIPVKDEMGVLRGYKRGADGQVVMTKTKGTVLKDLAKAGSGSFYHATFQGDAVTKLRSDIEDLKKSQFESGEIRSYNEHFQVLLMLALAFALFELWLGERRARGRIWKGRFEVAGD
jgi:Ca-activated chloride channel family protein